MKNNKLLVFVGFMVFGFQMYASGDQSPCSVGKYTPDLEQYEPLDSAEAKRLSDLLFEPRDHVPTRDHVVNKKNYSYLKSIPEGDLSFSSMNAEGDELSNIEDNRLSAISVNSDDMSIGFTPSFAEQEVIETRSRSNAMFLETPALSPAVPVVKRGELSRSETFFNGMQAGAGQNDSSQATAEQSGGVWYYSKSKMPWNKGKMKQRSTDTDIRSQVEEAIFLNQRPLLQQLLRSADAPRIDNDLLDTAYLVHPDVVVDLLKAKTQQAYEEQESATPSPNSFSSRGSGSRSDASISPLCYPVVSDQGRSFSPKVHSKYSDKV